MAEVRHLATREGWCYHHIQAIIVSIDQYAEAALGETVLKDYGYYSNEPRLGDEHLFAHSLMVSETIASLDIAAKQ